ncbi:MAG: AAA family ATPase, partial [Acetobacteraceae bacterium]|nr:AAA family ATPase [Acetobacteraceae bacterium]
MSLASVPATTAETAALLAAGGYVADPELATTVHLALAMHRPLLLEGEPGTGKTEIAKVLAAGLGRRLVRLQCYDGMDLSA